MNENDSTLDKVEDEATQKKKLLVQFKLDRIFYLQSLKNVFEALVDHKN